LAVPCQAQKFSFKEHRTSLAFAFANGLSDGTRDAAMFHMNDASSRWWNSDESWENKYRDYPKVIYNLTRQAGHSLMYKVILK